MSNFLEKLRLMFLSSKTAVAGVLTGICGGASLLDMVPDGWKIYVAWVCLTATTFGFIAAADADKTHAKQPTKEPVDLPKE